MSSLAVESLIDRTTLAFRVKTENFYVHDLLRSLMCHFLIGDR